MPFVTFQTVSSYRALRQAVRMAAVVLELQQRQKKSPENNIDSESRNEMNEKEELRRRARHAILNTEMAIGIIILQDTRETIELQEEKARKYHQVNPEQQEFEVKVSVLPSHSKFTWRHSFSTQY